MLTTPGADRGSHSIGLWLHVIVGRIAADQPAAVLRVLSIWVTSIRPSPTGSLDLQVEGKRIQQ